MRVAICDDSKAFLDAFYRVLSKWVIRNGINTDIKMFECGDDLLYDIENKGHFQIVIIEIELKDSDSLKVATKITHMDPLAIIIFVSMLEYCHQRVYRVHPFYLFTKPIKYRELSFVMEKALRKLDVDSQSFCFYYKTFYYAVPVKEIIYFFSDGRKIGVVSLHKRYYFYGKLDLINNEMQKMANIFLRIHKSFLVNMRHIRMYNVDHIEVEGNECLPISRSNKNVIKNALHNRWK